MTDDSGIVPLRQSKQGEPQVADWLAKLDRGDLSAEERAAFSRWLAEDPKNKQAITDVAAMWYGLSAPLSRLGMASRQVRTVAPPDNLSSRLAARIPSRWKLAGAVGALGALAAIGAISYFFVQRPIEITGYYATRIGETRDVSLEDGSELSLNTNSIVEQDYSKDERVLRLIAGEAIFDVAHDEDRPFIVYAANGVIRAVGTRFAVRVDSQKLSVTVTEGRIALDRRKDESAGTVALESIESQAPAAVMVGQGEAAEIDRAARARKETISDSELDERLSWAEGRLVFYDKELQSVVDEVARYTTVQIEIADETIKTRKITGILQIGDVDRMLEGIEASLDINADWVTPDLVRLTEG